VNFPVPPARKRQFQPVHPAAAQHGAEAAYNGVIGSHLQNGELNCEQLTPAYVDPYGASLLNSLINSPAAVAAGLSAQFPAFQQLWGSPATVAQSLRPYPRYSSIDTWNRGGDHSGHSTYNVAVVELQKRYSNGLTCQVSLI
jgi:hypothetical protein